MEAARRRNSNKRGGRDTVFALIDIPVEAPVRGEELLAIEELERLDPRQALLVESRFFGGLDVAETAELLDVSEATIHREWRAARAWLQHRLRPAE